MSSMAPPGMGKVMDSQFGEDDRLQGTDADAYDILRDLFLGSEDPQPDAPATPEGRVSEVVSPVRNPAKPFVDALILGHLPVLQSAWVMQYARDTAAQRGGPIALIRVRAEETTIDLVGLGTTRPPAQLSSFDESIAAATGVVAGFILRVDATNEPILARLDSIDTLTLLTGADEVAVLASYQTVKKLFPASDEVGPEARLAIMGASPEKAMEAASKLEKTAAAFLDREINISACVARIGPGKSSLLFRGRVDGNIADVVARVRKAMEPVPIPTSPAPQPAAARTPSLEPTSPPEHVVPPVSVVSRLGHIQHEAPSAPPVTAAPTSAVAATADPHPLTAHVKDLLLSAVRCPYEAAVEFALDARGGLHLLAYAESAQVASSLLAAGGWAKAHQPLIALAMKGQGLNHDERTAPTLHLLTPTVKDHRGLCDAGVRLHLLARVEIENRKGWFCTEVG